MSQPGYMPSSDQFPNAKNPLIFQPQKKVGVKKDNIVGTMSKKQHHNTNFRKMQFQQPLLNYQPDNFTNTRPTYEQERLLNIFDPKEELMTEHDQQLAKELGDNISVLSGPKTPSQQASKSRTVKSPKIMSPKFIKQGFDEFQKIPFGKSVVTTPLPQTQSAKPKGYQTIKQSKIKNAPQNASVATKGFNQLFSESHSRLKLIHPTKPLIISDNGFRIKIQDLSAFSDKNNCEDDAEPSSVYLEMPFTNKIIQIENLLLTQDGNYLITIVKSQDIPFQMANFHIVIFSLCLESPQANGTTFGHVCNYIIPGMQYAWNEQNSCALVDDPAQGEAVKIIEFPSQL